MPLHLLSAFSNRLFFSFSFVLCFQSIFQRSSSKGTTLSPCLPSGTRNSGNVFELSTKTQTSQHGSEIELVIIQSLESVHQRQHSTRQDHHQVPWIAVAQKPPRNSQNSTETMVTDSYLCEKQGICAHPIILRMKVRRPLQRSGSYQPTRTPSKVSNWNHPVS